MHQALLVTGFFIILSCLYLHNNYYALKVYMYMYAILPTFLPSWKWWGISWLFSSSLRDHLQEYIIRSAQYIAQFYFLSFFLEDSLKLHDQFNLFVYLIFMFNLFSTKFVENILNIKFEFKLSPLTFYCPRVT